MNNQAPRWQVTGQTPTSRPGPNGQFQSGMLITFTLASGGQYTVFVADKDYTPDAARSIIAARVEQIEQVGSLKG